jgi:di/tripeptidase
MWNVESLSKICKRAKLHMVIRDIEAKKFMSHRWLIQEASTKNLAQMGQFTWLRIVWKLHSAYVLELHKSLCKIETQRCFFYGR